MSASANPSPTPHAFDPLASAERDYHCGVLRLIWDVNRTTNDRTLLCGCVELVPTEIPAPLNTPERCKALSSKHLIYATDRILTLSDSMAWLELARSGRVVRPNKNGAIVLGDDAPTFVATVLDEHPPAPLLATSSQLVPFVASWESDTRVRHLVARDFRIQQLWTPEELSSALRWIKEDSHFELEEFPEHWGSIHLLAPNPVFRRCISRLDRSSGKTELVLALELRAGQSVEGLEFQLESKGPAGTVYLASKRLTNATERFTLPGEPEDPYERIIDQRRGLIYNFGPFVYGQDASLSVTMNVVAQTRNVAVELADGSKGDYQVGLPGPLSQTMEIGAPPRTEHAVQRLAAEQRARNQRSAGRANQRWFKDQVADAVTELRKLVRNAKEQLLVADPYFGGDDVRRVLLAVQEPSVLIRVLAGGDHLRRKALNQVEEGDYLEHRILEATNTGSMNPLSVRVMGGGSSPPLHDRFMLVDETLWLLGSSLHSFGSRGTMLLRVPDPVPVLEALETIWLESDDFGAVWLPRRKSERGPK